MIYISEFDFLASTGDVVVIICTTKIENDTDKIVFIIEPKDQYELLKKLPREGPM